MTGGPPEDDRDLIARWRTGDVRAGNTLFDRYFASLYRFFDHRVGPDAADLVQRTFLSCVEGRDRFREEASFRTYLFGVARNELLEHLRSKKRFPGSDAGASSIEASGSTVGTKLDRHREQRQLLEALRSLSLDHQLALELHYWEGLSGPELARVMEVPEGTVRSRLRRAREALLEQMRSVAASPAAHLHDMDDTEAWATALAGLRAGLPSGG